MSRDPKYDELSQAQEKDEELKENGGKFDKKIAVGQVTIRLPLDPNPLNLIALAYGFLPWAVPIGLVIYFLCTWHFIYIYGPLMSGILAIINEGILKKIFNEPRPKQSANKHKDGSMKPGMPSGHVLNAASIMVWALLEVYFNGPGLEKHQHLTYMWLGVILAVHIPVPWARWYNLDHSVSQCLVSSVLGLFAGFGAFYLRTHYFSGVWKPWLDAAGETLSKHHHAVVTFWRPPWVAAVTTAAPKLLLL